MLLDLGRNDVSRVADWFMRVTDQFIIEYYSHVMHIVSNVTGQLKAVWMWWMPLFGFPARTVGGAPKVRAMEIIDELVFAVGIIAAAWDIIQRHNGYLYR